jgi:hypothetical protein
MKAYHRCGCIGENRVYIQRVCTVYNFRRSLGDLELYPLWIRRDYYTRMKTYSEKGNYGGGKLSEKLRLALTLREFTRPQE